MIQHEGFLVKPGFWGDIERRGTGTFLLNFTEKGERIHSVYLFDGDFLIPD